MVVSFRYIMRDGIGNVLEDTSSGVPTRYLHGTVSILPFLQDQMEGLKQGDSKKVILLQSSGHSHADYFFDVVIESVRQANENELMLGYPLEDIPDDCGDDCECYKTE